MTKTSIIKDSAFDSMETITKVLANTELDQHAQLFIIKQVVYSWSLFLKHIVNQWFMADDTDKHIMWLSGMDVKRNMGNAKPMPIYGEEV